MSEGEPWLVSEVVHRGRRGRSEAEMDCRMLWWIGRFRFVTARELSERFEISEQRINARVRRLLAAGLLGEHRAHVSESRAVYLASRGASAIGETRRRPPRGDIQRRHELAVVRLAVGLELAGRRVWTERECRRQHRPAQGRHWSVEVIGRNGREQRWPDLVVDLGEGRRRAVELELSIKHSERLRRIVDGYGSGLWVFDEVHWLVEQPRHLVRLRRLFAEQDRARDLFPELRSPVQTAELWEDRPAAASA